jgi:hypothetical protein
LITENQIEKELIQIISSISVNQAKNHQNLDSSKMTEQTQELFAEVARVAIHFNIGKYLSLLIYRLHCKTDDEFIKESKKQISKNENLDGIYQSRVIGKRRRRKSGLQNRIGT